MSPTPIIAVSHALNHSPNDAKTYSPELLATILNASAELTWYENIPDDTPIRMYFDFDCKDVEQEDFNGKKVEVLKDAKDVLEKVLGRPTTEENTLWAESCGEKDGKMKVSFHAIIQDFTTTKATNKKVAEKMKSLCEYTDIQPYGSGACGIQKMRLVGCIKEDNDRRKMRKMGEYDITKTFITNVDDAVPEFKLSDDDWFVDKALENLTKKDYDTVDGATIKELIPDLEAMGFTNIVPIGDSYNFMCDQRNGKTPCPLCDQTHVNNQYRIRSDGRAYHVKNHSKKCNELVVKRFACEVDEEEDVQQTEYERMKETFEVEKNVAKILKPKPMYVWGDEDTLVNKQHLTEVFDDFLTSKTTKFGQPIPFTTEWYRDDKKRKYDKIDFRPYSTEDNKPDANIYNMFHGFRASKLDFDISPEERAERVKPFLRLLKVNTASGGYEYALNWIANQVQNPETDNRAKIALVFQGEERGGKTEQWDYFGKKILGEEMYGYTHTPDKDVFGQYPTFVSKKVLCVIDEADCYKHEKMLFGLITAPTILHRPMYVDPVKITATHNLVFTSNLSKQVRIAKDGGKFAVFKTGNELNPILAENKQEAREFWDHWWKVWKHDDRNAKAVYDYLMNHEIPKNYDWVNERPTDSETHQEMRLSDLSPIIKFIEHLITSAYPSHLKQTPDDNTKVEMFKKRYEYRESLGTQERKKHIKASDMFELFKAYYPRYTRFDMDAQSFATRIRSELKKEGVLSCDKEESLAFHKSKSDGKIVWRINRIEAFAWLKARKFTLYDELPKDTVDFLLYSDFNLDLYEVEKVMKETLG